MSIIVLSRVLEHSEATLGARLVLIALAEFAHDDGSRAFPSVETLERRTRMSRRAVQMALRKLEEEGEIEQSGKSPAGTNVYRVLTGTARADSARGAVDDAAGAQNLSSRGEAAAPNPSRPNTSTRQEKKIVSPADEPEGFAQWLGQHVAAGGTFGLSLSVPRASTARRSALARTFARLRGEGHELEEFRLASLGVVGDAFMREGGHVDPENVLRVEKFGKRVDAGRRVEALAAAAPVETVDWSRFDA